MLKRGFAFEFEVPDGWADFQQGRRQVFQGPGREELIVSGYIIEGGGPGPELEAARDRLFRNAVQSVERAAAHPELVVTRPLGRADAPDAFECWRLGSRTADETILFEQAIFVGPRAILLVTFEAPASAQAQATYESFLLSVRPSADNQHPSSRTTQHG